MLNIDDRLISQTTPDEMYFLMLLAKSIKHPSQTKVVISTSGLCEMMGKSKPFVLSVKKSLIEKGLLSTKLLKSENNGFSASSYVIETPYIGVYLPAKGIEIIGEKVPTLVNENDKGGNRKLQGVVNENDKGSNSNLQGLVNDVYPYNIKSSIELTSLIKKDSSSKISHEIFEGAFEEKKESLSPKNKEKKEGEKEGVSVKKTLSSRKAKEADPMTKKFLDTFHAFYLKEFKEKMQWVGQEVKGIETLKTRFTIRENDQAFGRWKTAGNSEETFVKCTDEWVLDRFSKFLIKLYSKCKTPFDREHFTPQYIGTNFTSMLEKANGALKHEIVKLPTNYDAEHHAAATGQKLRGFTVH